MKFRVKKEHKSNYSNPIRFEAGDTVLLGELDNEYEGWIRATTPDGNEGWAPVSFVRASDDGRQGTALRSYSAQELNVAPGQLLLVKQELNGWYWCVSNNGDSGWVPKHIGAIE
ncbi:MAG: SH3 domain-containing protein [Pseudohongiellaceae bacterium]|nr:SH3 domain-containing protein [Pseudohongiellaceae bacterium]